MQEAGHFKALWVTVREVIEVLGFFLGGWGELGSEGILKRERERVTFGIWVNASSKEKIFLKATPSEEPSRISPPLTYGIPPSLACSPA